VAKGRATGREGLIRALIAAGILLAPTPGPAGTLMLADPDHLATQMTTCPRSRRTVRQPAELAC
jgi:hypothetical protein